MNEENEKEYEEIENKYYSILSSDNNLNVVEKEEEEEEDLEQIILSYESFCEEYKDYNIIWFDK